MESMKATQLIELLARHIRNYGDAVVMIQSAKPNTGLYPVMKCYLKPDNNTYIVMESSQ